jgi:5-methylcytosine-specific restriction enzyme B
MHSYKDYEKQVFEWLSKKNEKDETFNFSVRQKASKGSELDYFIGTEKSNYFGTTFWFIPVSFPGSSSDCINLFFMSSVKGYSYFFEFTQTRSPHNEQNELALKLIQNLKPKIKKALGLQYKSASIARMEDFKSKPIKESYDDLNNLFIDLDKQLDILLSLVDDEIKTLQSKDNFKAHRLIKKEFQQMKQKMERRFEKYAHIKNNVSEEEPVTSKIRYWLLSPGNGADRWDDFYEDGIIALRLKWDRLGELSKLQTKEEVVVRLQELENETGSKKNDSTAIFEFSHVMKTGDIVLAKRGRDELLGYGEVKSDIIYDPLKEYYKNYRKVEWKLNGTWKTDVSLHPKTLTDITKYPTEHPKYSYYYERLMATMSDEEKRIIPFPLNIILYGSPGTGKTYHSVNYALGIIENEEPDAYNGETKEQRKEFVKQFNEYKTDGQIEFITFHQSFAYEDFVEGIKPALEGKQLSFERRDGIFKIIADRARKNYISAKKDQPKAVVFDEVFERRFTELREGVVDEVEIKMKKSSFFITDITEKSIHFRKSNGESKHTLSINTLNRMFEDEDNKIILGGLMPYYEPLVRDLKAYRSKIKVNKGDRVALKNYVLVIDEINRANISRVFGELITLIEKDKRLDGDNEIRATLPSGEEFVLSPNLFIVGTMNTADKSIALLDIALRRRFNFKAFYPDSELIEDEILQKTHSSLNEYIIEDKGIDFTIGHSYFMNKSEIDLPEIMNDSVIPLLTEYYMSDMHEVQRILQRAKIKTDTKNGFLVYDEINE